MNKKCKYCNHLKEQHYESEGEKPYIKYVCGNRFGISDYSQIDPEIDYCSRFEESEMPFVEVGDDDPLFLVLVWYGRRMSDANLRYIQPTGKKYPAIVKIMEELKG